MKDMVASRLKNHDNTDETSEKAGIKSTGIDLLDKRIEGGLPEDSLVCIYADPISMPEVFLYQLSSERKAYYVNTSRPLQYIQRNISNMGFSVKDMGFIDVFSQYYLNEYGQFVLENKYRDKEIFDFIEHQLNNLPGEDFNVVFDSISFFMRLDVSRGLKDWLLNKIYLLSKESRNLFYMYLMKGVHPIKITNMVIEISDVVFNIRTEEVGPEVKNILSVPKIRSRSPVKETFKFDIEEGIRIDTSREIL
ncbi:MAG: RAD55 family ATPase [Archaeoglobaceae archaeon]